MQNLLRPLDHPVRTLFVSCVAWKFFLLLLAMSSPGPGYDTSTALLLASSASAFDKPLPSALHTLVSRLTRWDAIYFVRIANRSYVFEQEWMAGWGHTRLISFCTRGLSVVGIGHYVGLEGLVGIVIAHAAHLASVITLYYLTLAVFPDTESRRLGLITALLHIFSPAGLFLSAPYAESSCAFLTFAGCLLFVKSLPVDGQPSLRRDLLVLLSGITFGVATTFRSNALLNGLMLLEGAFRTLLDLRDGFGLGKVRRVVFTGLGGICVGIGFLLPQYIAYEEFCMGGEGSSSRAWCLRRIPSVYVFIQDHYWNCGLFRYWTVSNIPLFLLASPMMFLMVVSGAWGLRHGSDRASAPAAGAAVKDRPVRAGTVDVVKNMAASQLIMALLTATTAHVQIVTRVSSAYPVCLWYLAVSLKTGKGALVKNFIRIMVIYAVVQAGLFSCFLPPA